jgi:hypothetical protein
MKAGGTDRRTHLAWAIIVFLSGAAQTQTPGALPSALETRAEREAFLSNARIVTDPGLPSDATPPRRVESQFEDSFAEQYRDIAATLPLPALLGKALAPEELRDSLRAFYNYFDLCNEQVFLAAQGRFRDATWLNWRDGIRQHFARPAFQQAWSELAPHLDGSFDDLRAWLHGHGASETKGSG